MTITKNLNDGLLTVLIEGRLDTITAPECEEQIKDDVVAAKEVNLDFKNLEYISSAGLRLIISIQKEMNAKDGSLVITNASDEVKEIFEITGFTSFLNIK